MTRLVLRRLRRFGRAEDGNVTIEFAIWFTLVFMLLASGIEIAYMNLRHAMLERAVDLSVRDIRLGTGSPPSYLEVRDSICEKANIIQNCAGNLRLEMIPVSPRAMDGFTESPDCQNAEQEPRPVRSFAPGMENQLMLLRVCMTFKPVLPTIGLGEKLHKDAEGYSWLVVKSAFVQEPR
ncbi:TadE/TadG family type IV pilus assembly protein [Citreimonas salinaria]|uniref:TadE-like protein n=1 Tax=Citreimonas salinaria TaxID=321339 RepID=A0A1H3JKQ9_9RHOB|nr:TadE/TadG family type IV pilus assembly protein [Citreimonas salinaria]SDY40512.1 TadE-like protein [Citreimonas salinaria]